MWLQGCGKGIVVGCEGVRDWEYVKCVGCRGEGRSVGV